MRHIYKVIIEENEELPSEYFVPTDISEIAIALRGYNAATSILVEKIYTREILGKKFQKNPTYPVFSWKSTSALTLDEALKAAFLK